jgi:flagellar biosynthesis/type III secretory pathway chaperone
MTQSDLLSITAEKSNLEKEIKETEQKTSKNPKTSKTSKRSSSTYRKIKLSAENIVVIKKALQNYRLVTSELLKETQKTSNLFTKSDDFFIIMYTSKEG